MDWKNFTILINAYSGFDIFYLGMRHYIMLVGNFKWNLCEDVMTCVVILMKCRENLVWTSDEIRL